MRGVGATLCALAALFLGQFALAQPAAAKEYPPPPPMPFTVPGAALEQISFVSWPAWQGDDHAHAFIAFQRSCGRLLNAAAPERSFARALLEVCRKAAPLGSGVAGEQAKSFFEAEFRPLRIVKLGDMAGFVTAYYEPVVKASYLPSTEHSQPFLKKPDDLVSARAGGGFDSRSPAGRMVGGRLQPYFERSEIEKGALAGRGLELAWSTPSDVFFTQIQGSARLRFADGKSMRVNYAAYNGHRYTPIGRVLVERGVASREEMSMDFLRAYLAQSEDIASELRAQNKSYVFFREVEGLTEEDGPIGAQGIPLTDWRSLAVDRALHVYGTPIFVEGILPTGMMSAGEPFDRLMVAQDTGSAIVGPARGDLYLGSGAEMGQIAGRIRHPVIWTVLVPASLSYEFVQWPLPPERPTP